MRVPSVYVCCLWLRVEHEKLVSVLARSKAVEVVMFIVQGLKPLAPVRFVD